MIWRSAASGPSGPPRPGICCRITCVPVLSPGDLAALMRGKQVGTLVAHPTLAVLRTYYGAAGASSGPSDLFSSGAWQAQSLLTFVPRQVRRGTRDAKGDYGRGE